MSVTKAAEAAARKVNGYRMHLETTFPQFVPTDRGYGLPVIQDFTMGYSWFGDDYTPEMKPPHPDEQFFLAGKDRIRARDKAIGALQNFDKKTVDKWKSSLDMSKSLGAPARPVNPFDWFHEYLLSKSFAAKYGADKGKRLAADLTATLKGMRLALLELLKNLGFEG